MILTTDRLILRPFDAGDIDAFAAINGDLRVMRFFPAPYDRAQTARMIAVFAEKRERFGYAFSAIERRCDNRLIGMAGLSRFDADVPFAPCTEIGWRLEAAQWRQGYATEAARAWLAHAFDTLELDEVVSFAPRVNGPSLAVMQRLGLQRDPSRDFLHPALAVDSPLREMHLCAISRDMWNRQSARGA